MPEIKLVGPIRKIGPTYNMSDVAKLLGTSEQWVYKLAIRDPEEYPANHLPCYVKNPDGPGWIRKIGTNPRGEIHDVVLMFYEADVKKYIEEHHEPERERTAGARHVSVRKNGKPVTYTVRVSPEEETLITRIAQEQLDALGYVNRTEISRILQADPYKYSARIYDKVLKVASDNNWPMPARGVKLKERLA